MYVLSVERFIKCVLPRTHPQAESITNSLHPPLNSEEIQRCDEKIYQDI